MFVIRPVTSEDASALQTFAASTSPGIANLPAHPPRLQRMIDKGIASFHKLIASPGDEIYTFILEESSTGLQVGTCSIMSRLGIETTYCTFALERQGGVPQYLSLKEYTSGPSELCALYLLPKYRKSGLGKLLSLSRLLFIASNPQRFNSILMADMRGVIIEGCSPFWDSIGAIYSHWSYLEILKKIDCEEVQLCSLFPRDPIPWSTLTPQAQQAAGHTHPHTLPAFYLLTNEGLLYRDEISVLDGGPILSGTIAELTTVTKNHSMPLAAIVPSLSEKEPEALICNAEVVNFRACRSRISLDDEGKNPSLDSQTAYALHLEVGSPLLYRTLS